MGNTTSSGQNTASNSATNANTNYGSNTNSNTAQNTANNSITQAASGPSAAAQGFLNTINPMNTAANINAFQNPYMQQVLGAQEALQQQQGGEAQAQLLGNSPGAINGNRLGEAQATLQRQLQLANNATNTGILSQGFNTAANLATTQGQQALGAAGLAGTQSSQGTQQLGSTAGTTQAGTLGGTSTAQNTAQAGTGSGSSTTSPGLLSYAGLGAGLLAKDGGAINYASGGAPQPLKIPKSFPVASIGDFGELHFVPKKHPKKFGDGGTVDGAQADPYSMEGIQKAIKAMLDRSQGTVSNTSAQGKQGGQSGQGNFNMASDQFNSGAKIGQGLTTAGQNIGNKLFGSSQDANSQGLAGSGGLGSTLSNAASGIGDFAGFAKGGSADQAATPSSSFYSPVSAQSFSLPAGHANAASPATSDQYYTPISFSPVQAQMPNMAGPQVGMPSIPGASVAQASVPFPTAPRATSGKGSGGAVRGYYAGGRARGREAGTAAARRDRGGSLDDETTPAEALAYSEPAGQSQEVPASPPEQRVAGAPQPLPSAPARIPPAFPSLSGAQPQSGPQPASPPTLAPAPQAALTPKPLVGRQAVAGSIRDELSNAGMSEAGIRGTLANVKDESSFDPGLRHPDQPKWGGEAHYAHGLFQEGGAEWNKYAKWLEENHTGADWRDPRLQTQFLAKNLKENYPDTWEKMNKGTPEEAAQAFVSDYLKPAKQFELERRNRYGTGVPDIGHYLNDALGVTPTASTPGPSGGHEAQPSALGKIASALGISPPVAQGAGNKYLINGPIGEGARGILGALGVNTSPESLGRVSRLLMAMGQGQGFQGGMGNEELLLMQRQADREAQRLAGQLGIEQGKLTESTRHNRATEGYLKNQYQGGMGYDAQGNMVPGGWTAGADGKPQFIPGMVTGGGNMASKYMFDPATRLQQEYAKEHPKEPGLPYSVAKELDTAIGSRGYGGAHPLGFEKDENGTPRKIIWGTPDANTPLGFRRLHVDPEVQGQLALVKSENSALGKLNAAQAGRKMIGENMIHHLGTADQIINSPGIDNVLGVVQGSGGWQKFQNLVDSGQVEAPAQYSTLKQTVAFLNHELENMAHLQGTGAVTDTSMQELRAAFGDMLQSPNAKVLKARVENMRALAQGLLASERVSDLAHNPGLRELEKRQTEELPALVGAPQVKGRVAAPGPAGHEIEARSKVDGASYVKINGQWYKE